MDELDMNRSEKIRLIQMLQEKKDRQFKKNCEDRFWRLNNLYYIKTRKGRKVLLKLNKVQLKFYEALHYLNIILKSRQLGFTTFIQIFMLDACIFNDNTAAGVIAQTKADAEEFFNQKIKFAWDNIDQRVKNNISADNNTAKTLKFSNGSSIIVGTSLRSGTFQYLHISEFGKICAKFPQKALEIRTGALNTVAVGQYIFIESTAEGQGGDFYEMIQQTKRAKLEDEILTDMDFKFHFFPWYEDKTLTLDQHIVYSKDLVNYFKHLETKGIILDAGQRSWYAKKQETQHEEMKREYPSTADEAFEVAIDGSYFHIQMAKIRELKQICRVPIDLNLPVHTAFDLGMADYMAIHFFQVYNREYRFINYYENSGEGMQHYIAYLQQYQAANGFVWGKHLAPHDINVRELAGNGKTRRQVFAELGISFETIPKVKAKADSIQAARSILPNCWFDEENCATAIMHLDNYSKHWNIQLGMWREAPLHNTASNCADAFQTFAQGLSILTEPEFVDYSYKSEWV